jgi:hypothetical protein
VNETFIRNLIIAINLSSNVLFSGSFHRHLTFHPTHDVVVSCELSSLFALMNISAALIV